LFQPSPTRARFLFGNIIFQKQFSPFSSVTSFIDDYKFDIFTNLLLKWHFRPLEEEPHQPEPVYLT